MLAIPAAAWLAASATQAAVMLGSILVLMIVEVINSAIEAIVDRIGSEWHELSRIAKDLGSAAVLLASLFPITIWGGVLLGRFGLLSL